MSSERLISQLIEIITYDYNIKYHQLKNKGLKKNITNIYEDKKKNKD
jgi:hypothetical protein